eukprot:s33_g74.t1
MAGFKIQASPCLIYDIDKRSKKHLAVSQGLSVSHGLLQVVSLMLFRLRVRRQEALHGAQCFVVALRNFHQLGQGLLRMPSIDHGKAAN